MIFVFGANKAGRHAKGAALLAARHFGAQEGTAFGLQGDSFGIPTRDERIETLPIDEIARHVEQFKEFAAGRPDLLFRVSRIGCGLAGYSDEQIWPLFSDAPANCLLPGIWLQKRNPRMARCIVSGVPTFADRGLLTETLDYTVSRRSDLQNVMIVSTGEDGAGKLAETWAENRGIAYVQYPADRRRFGREADLLRNLEVCWYGTHLVAFDDGQDSGTQGLIAAARQGNIKQKVISLAPADV